MTSRYIRYIRYIRYKMAFLLHPLLFVTSWLHLGPVSLHPLHLLELKKEGGYYGLFSQ